MPSTVNIGTLEGLLRWKADDAELNRSLTEVAKKADVSKNQIKQYNRELNAITSSYEKVAASLNPVVANTQKYERAERALVAALKAGIITQEQHNKQLDLAKNKYLSASASTLTWREEMQRLTNVVTPLSPRISNLVSTVQSLTGALGASAQASQAAATGSTAAAAAAGAATSSFAAMGAALAPLAPLLAALTASLAAVYVGLKVFDFLKVAVVEGTKTQQVIERLNNSLRANGSYSELSANQLVTLAESYELLTGKSKEQIIAAETILSRFDSLNKQSFPEALRVVLAYSKATGLAADESAKKLGPALDGNIRSLGSLKDIGITFTAAQRKVLTSLAETGDKAQYQAKLLEILREKVGDLSDEYDKNLIRQVDRAGIIFNDFQESIANQVIPAIEDVVNEIVISLGGWDALKKKVNEVGSAIGNFIRTAIYGLAIGFHELGIVIDAFVATVAPKLAAVFKAHALIFSSPGMLRMSQDLSNAGKNAASSALDHGEAIERLTRGLLEHRTALEGDTESYEVHGSAVDDIIAKNSQLKSQIEELNQLFIDHGIELDRIHELRMLAAGGKIDLSTRLAEEEKINQKYRDRIDLLKLQAKWGDEIGKRLFDMRKFVEKIELKAKVELELATKLKPIEIPPRTFEDLKDINLSPFDQAMIDKIKEQVADAKVQAEEFRQTLITPEQELSNLLAAIDKLATTADEGGKMLLTAAEAERLRFQAIERYTTDQINAWAGFAQFIGQELGGVFQYVADAARAVQTVNSTADSLGGWESVGGAMGGTIAAFVILYQYADAIITKHKGEKYGTATDYNVMAGVDMFGFTSQASLELGHQIKSILATLENQLRISAEDLAKIEIKVSNDGKQVQAWVKDKWIGTFDDVNTAIRQALITSMADPESNLRGLSDLMVAGLADWTSPDMEGLFEFLTQLRSISDLDLSDSVISLQQSFIEINRMREALNRLDQSSQAVIDAHNSLADAQKRLYDQTVNSMLGIDTSAADAVRSLAGFQKGIGDVAGTYQAGVQSTIDVILEQIKILDKAAEKTGQLSDPEGRPGPPGGTGRGGSGYDGSGFDNTRLFLSGTIDALETEREKLQRELDLWIKKLGEVPKALSDQQIDLGVFTAIEDDLRKSGKYSELIAEMERERVKIKYEELRLQLVTLGAWERWAGVWQDLYNQAMAGAGRGGIGGRGAGGGSDRDSVRDFIKDKEFELSLVGLTEYQKALKELDRQYDDLIKQAGKDKKLKEDLLALKEKELRLLEQEQKKSTTEKFREFLGLVTPFDKVRKTSADLIKEIQASPFGDARKAAMIGRVLAETEKQLDRLAKEVAVGLFGSMISDMEKFGATEEQLAEARKMQALLEHEMRLANYALTIAQLEAEGRLAPEVIAKFKEMYDFFAGIDPTLFIGGDGVSPGPEEGSGVSSYSSLADQSNELYDILNSVRDTLAEWSRSALSEVLSRAHELTDSFAELMKDVDKIKSLGPAWDYTIEAQEAYEKLVDDFINDTLSEFEDVTEGLEGELLTIGTRFTDINAALVHLGASQEDLQRAEEARLSAINAALDQYLAPIREFRESMQIGDLSTLTSEEQFLSAQEKFREMLEQIQGGDLSQIGDVVPLAQQYAQLLQSYTGGEGLRFGLSEIENALLSIEELVPGFAEEMAAIGTEENPMIMESSGMITAIEDSTAAVNNGNVLILAEARIQVEELRAQKEKLIDIETILSNPLTISVQNIA